MWKFVLCTLYKFMADKDKVALNLVLDPNHFIRECPNRCNPNTDSIKPIGKALLRMYNDLDVKCKYYDQCKQVVKLVDLEQHEKICQLPKCGNFELCGNYMKKVNLSFRQEFVYNKSRMKRKRLAVQNVL